METTIVYRGYIGHILGIYRVILGLNWDNGKENGSYYSILGVYRDNGKENGSYHSIMGCESTNPSPGPLLEEDLLVLSRN